MVWIDLCFLVRRGECPQLTGEAAGTEGTWPAIQIRIPLTDLLNGNVYLYQLFMSIKRNKTILLVPSI